jgi:hypothetical protein
MVDRYFDDRTARVFFSRTSLWRHLRRSPAPSLRLFRVNILVRLAQNVLLHLSHRIARQLVDHEIGCFTGDDNRLSSASQTKQSHAMPARAPIPKFASNCRKL